MQQQKHSSECESEETLVQQSLAGNQYAFEGLVRQHEAALLSYIHNHLGRNGDNDLVSDVFQYVLLQFYRSLPTLSAGRPLKPWLFRVAHNRCVDILRRNKRRHILLFSEVEGENDDHSLLHIIQDMQILPEEVVEQQEMQLRFRQAVQMLPPRYRAIVLFRCLYEMSFPEIAQQMKIPNTTVKTYFHRARPLLRAALQTL